MYLNNRNDQNGGPKLSQYTIISVSWENFQGEKTKVAADKNFCSN